MSCIYVADCACELVAKGCAFPGLTVIECSSDRVAAEVFVLHSQMFDRSIRVARPPADRYFLVHGPGGHVIGVR